MSLGPIRNIPRRGRAQTPFYPLIESRPGPSTSRLQFITAHVHDAIEIISDDEAAGRAASRTVGAEDVVDIPSDDEAPQQTDQPIHNTSLSDSLAAATAELETLRAAIQKVWSSLKGILLWSALFVKWYSKIYIAHKRPPVGLTSRNISMLPLSSAVITAVRRCFGHVPFTCPTCRDLVGKHQPYKVIALGQLSDALSSLGGEQGEEDPSTDWTGYFSV
ncbi:hypothetical protein P692DRAFT_20848935 [Suillus brevipes Sb2]|nr:hypothetical protein P692DRAFT_20848935 [Suillus brevipes Sb2]